MAFTEYRGDALDQKARFPCISREWSRGYDRLDQFIGCPNWSRPAAAPDWEGCRMPKLNPLKLQITGKTELDIEIEYLRWLKRNSGKVRIIKKHSIDRRDLSMLVEYAILRPRRGGAGVASR